jgi:hypothetical protein
MVHSQAPAAGKNENRDLMKPTSIKIDFDKQDGLLSDEEKAVAAKAAAPPGPEGEDFDGAKERKETGRAERSMKQV